MLLHLFKQLPFFLPNVAGEHLRESSQIWTTQCTGLGLREVLAQLAVLCNKFVHKWSEGAVVPGDREDLCFFRREVILDFLRKMLFDLRLPRVNLSGTR